MYVLSILKVLHVLLLFSFLRTRATFFIISNRNFSQIRQPHVIMHQKHVRIQFNRAKKNVIVFFFCEHSSHVRGRAGALLLPAALSTQERSQEKHLPRFPVAQSTQDQRWCSFCREEGNPSGGKTTRCFSLSLNTTFYFRSISITRSMAFVCNSTRSIT